MANWKDNLRPGSFRGVKFFIDISNFSTGRRAVLHEYPNRETPSTEDMGRISDGFEVEGHVVGNDYFAARQELERVFAKKGPGELIHPFHGLQIVQVGPVQISESNLEGAIAKFTAKFMEAGDNRFPKGTNDKGAVLESAIEASLVEIKKDFDDNFSIADLPAHAIDSARDLVSSAQETFDEVTSVVADVSDGIADLAFSTRNLVAEVNDLLQAPSVLSQRLLDSFALLEATFSGEEDKTNAYGSFYSFGDDQEDILGNTPIKDKERENSDKFINFIRRVATVKSAGTASTTDFSSFDDALSKREDITTVIEAQIREDDDTDLYQSLIDVNAALVDAVPDVDAQLPNIKELTLKDTTPTLLIAYDQFEDPRNEQDIIDRNNIRNPGFVEVGSTLEILDVQ